MKYLILLLLLFILIACNAPAAYSCSPDVKSHRQDYREAKAIFIGKVVSIDFAPDVPENLRGEVDARITFSIEKRWKGRKAPTISVFAYYGPPTCHGFEFRKDERYLVYAFGNELFVSTMFSRSRPIDQNNQQGQKELQQLDSPWFKFTSHMPFLK